MCTVLRNDERCGNQKKLSITCVHHISTLCIFRFNHCYCKFKKNSPCSLHLLKIIDFKLCLHLHIKMFSNTCMWIGEQHANQSCENLLLFPSKVCPSKKTFRKQSRTPTMFAHFHTTVLAKQDFVYLQMFCCTSVDLA